MFSLMDKRVRVRTHREVTNYLVLLINLRT